MPGLHVFIGTKAQYVKTAPLLRRMDDAGIGYRLIDSGQHAEISRRLRAELGLRRPDHVLGGDHDITTIPQAIRWALALGTKLLRRQRLIDEVFGGDTPGICVVHGDTPSTLLSTLMARRAGLRVAHLEAGLRSHQLLHPFPEELIRVAVMRLSHILFAPDQAAVQNLDRMGLGSRTVATPGNTIKDALGDRATSVEHGPVVATLHRVENLHRGDRLRRYVELLVAIARGQRVRFVMHGPTIGAIDGTPLEKLLEDAGVERSPLLPHSEFVELLARAPFVLTDGGSIQEECALFGVPTLLWRGHTERGDGLGANVVLSAYDPAVAAEFLADPESYRRPPAARGDSPTALILEVLMRELEDQASRRSVRRGPRSG